MIFEGILWDVVDPQTVVASPDAKSGYSSPNAYLNKSGGKCAKFVANPINHSFVFVLALVAGAALSALLRGGVSREQRIMRKIWRVNFYDAPWKRYLVAFVSDFIVLYGARLAGGCTLGHMMSDMMQTAISGYIFSAGAILAGIPHRNPAFPSGGLVLCPRSLSQS